MKHQISLLGGLGLGTGLGAGLMYLLDPEGGRRRRALARDKAVHGMKVGGKSLRSTSIHLGNKTKGLAAKAGSRLRSRPQVQEDSSSPQGEATKSRRFSLRSVKPRSAALGLGALAGTVGLGLLARKRKVDDLTRPLSGSRTVRGEPSAQLEW